ncbi:Transcriptional activator domain-containing protein [Nitrosomonas nitrosa]|uniref:Transcriptional activator domain-containing protein n=1 Tax=Nitrosomonas nitrosa TaxID=52442 RepID=A0A8H8Z174_9PROT|nr:BTAD domain-containing putative transcriptional regulator [Nitrosomonas nitrosa]CAE6503125.1 Transcriptional activator domain-containing protein [Nitrosomonas nitrosa]
MEIKRYPTKILPPVYERVFERDRLFALVGQGKMAKVIWVNGAPGSGKTIFVASLLKKQQASFLWYRVDVSENNFADIFYFLALAAQKNYPRQKIKLPVFTAEYANDVENFACVFFRELFASLTRESAIVLDNCQELEKDATFFRLLQIAINQLPDGMQLICISRNRLNAALKRLQLNNELLAIGDAELQFIDQESQAFLKWLNPQLEDHQIHHIQLRTQGWAAGMVLMARQLSITGFSGDFSFAENIFDYLVSEILAFLPKELNEFLVTSALFTQLTAEMAIQLTGNRQAKSYLDELVSKNFLIERTAGATPIYRFHPLFRDLLLTQAGTLFTEEIWQELQHQAARILAKQGSPAEAILLYQQLQDWPSLKALLLQQAEQLISSGRHHTVSQWIEILPSEFLEADAWLSYWYAVALKPVDPLLAEERLEKCYQLFIIDHDIKGIYSAWVAAVETIAISWDDFSKLKVWVNRIDEIRKHYSASPSIELKIQFYAMALQAFSIYNIHHPLSRSLIRICEGIFRFIPIRSVRTALSLQLAQYYMFNLQLTKAQALFPYLEQALEDEALPIMTRIMSAYLLVVKNLLEANTIKGLEYTHKGLEISKASGLRVFEGMLFANSVGCHINNGDLISAEYALQKAVESRNDRQRIPIVMHYAYVVWLAALAENLQYALEQNKQALELAQLIHYEIAYVAFWSLEVQMLAELCQWQKAKKTLSLLSAAVKDINNKHNQIQYYVADAWCAYLQQNQPRALIALTELLRIMHHEQLFAFFGWRPKVLTPLCLLAIENGIEEEFAVRLLRHHRLLDCPPPHLEKWPWAVRIYSFGSLAIKVDGKLIEPTGKSPKKLLELLELIISLGGRKVNCDQLAEILWPEAEGDLARQSLETALYRIRKLIGKETVLVNNNLVSFNEHYCWLDLWAFEATATQLEQALNEGQQPVIVKLTDRLLTLYRDTFLKNADSGLVLVKQEQLLNKLCRLLDLVISFHERCGEHKLVQLLLYKELELKPLVEANYRRLMVYYLDLGQPDQALNIYHQCYRVLHKGFHISLSKEIQLLAKQIETSEQKYFE